LHQAGPLWYNGAIKEWLTAGSTTEWTADFYNTLGPGEATVSLNERFSAYNSYIFEGICYEVNLSREPGSRIERLTWPAGNELKPRNDSVMAA